MANRFLSNIKINDAYTFPASDGTNGQFIATDGAGNLSFQSAGEAGATVIYKDLFTGDNSTVEFTLANSVDNEIKTQVYFDGVYQSKENYTLSGNAITFSTAPPSGAAIEIITFATVAAADYNQKLNFYGKAVGAITKGDAVMFAGAQGDHFLIAKATQSALEDNHEYFLGLAAHDFANNQYGYVTQFGRLEAMDTSDYTAGDILWFDSEGTVAGAITTTEPAAPNTRIQIAAVVRVHQEEGVIFIRPTVHHELGETTDVSITSVADKDLLAWNAAGGVWENTKTLGDITTGNITTSGTVDGVDVSSFKEAYDSHNHDDRYYTELEVDVFLSNSDNWDTAFGWGNHASVGYLTSFTETDPIFSASPSAGITLTQISNWDTAFGWGNHANAGYLTSFTETDPIYTASSWYTTTNNSTNWNTAYSWGNHANAGYLTGYTETDPVYVSERNSLQLNKTVHPTLLFSTLADFDKPSGYSTMIQPGSYQNPLPSHGFYHIIARRDTGGGYGALLQSYNSHEIYHGNTTVNSNDISWYKIWTSGDFSSTNVSNWNTAYGWGNHSGLYLPLTGGTLTGSLNISSGNLIVGNYTTAAVQSGALNIGRIDTNYGWDGSSWAGDTRLGILANCLDTWEFGIHDSGESVESVFYYNSSTDIITMGRDLGWGSTPIVAANSFRAPIFYDSENTGYYVDANSTSVQYRLTNAGTLGTNAVNARNHFTQYNSGTTGPTTGWIAAAFGDASNNRVVIGQWSGNTGAIIGSHSGNLSDWAGLSYIASNHYFYGNSDYNGTASLIIDTGHSVIARGDMRAPIFYDSGNTNYYVNPDSTSNLYNLELGGAKHTYLYITPGNGYEAMVRFNGGSGSTWYVGSRTSTQLIGSTDAWHVYSQTAGATVSGTDTGGNTFASGSSRAPVFYDLDNTGYYLSPNSTSRLYNIETDFHSFPYREWDFSWGSHGANNSMPSMSFAMYDNYTQSGAPSSYGTVLDFYGLSGHQHDQLYFAQGSIRHRYGWYGNNNWSSWFDVYTSNNGSMQTPILYDSNNTGYYIDTSSSTTSIYMNGSIITTAPAGSILLKHAVSEVDAWIFQENATNWGLYWKNAPSGQHTFGSYTSVGAELVGMSAGNASGAGVLTSNYVGATSAYAQWMLSNYTGYIWSASTVYAAGDMRAPIFYDSNNTGYYLDPNGTSSLSRINFNGSGSKSIYGENIGNGYEAVKVAGNWDTFDIMGRVLDWTGSNLHFGDGYNGQSHASSYMNFATNGNIDYVRFGGDGYFEGDVIAYYSDARLKQNIKPIENALSIINSITGVTFEWNKKAEGVWKKKEGDEDFGLIAQEVEAVFPMGVAVQCGADRAKERGYADPESEHYDPLHKPTNEEEQYKTVRYDKMVAVAIQAIKELSDKIEELENKLNGIN